MTQLSNLRATPPIGPVLRPFQRFVELQASGGIVLLVATLVALVWANSPWATSYVTIWQTPVSVGIGGVTLAKPLLLWINDGLMTVFFFVVSLEIKRELLAGELASWRHALLPLATALGGMVVPAGLYLALNVDTPSVTGWGIPVATDTAFALGILALLGRRIPIGLKVLLTALAIIDDLGALVVITVAYTPHLEWVSVAISSGLLGSLVLANWVGMRHPAVYAVLGCGLWLAFLQAGLHATLAGVVLALVIPAWSRIDTGQYLRNARDLLQEFEAAGETRESMLSNAQRQAVFLELMILAEKAETPLQRLEHWLHPWVTFAILPLFALANAGVTLGSGSTANLLQSTGLGVIVGLTLGKPLGVTAAAWLAVRSGLTVLPAGVVWRQIVGVGCLAGIGFTMSLFITNLAFGTSSFVSVAKVAILTGSLISGLLGWSILRLSSGTPER